MKSKDKNKQDQKTAIQQAKDTSIRWHLEDHQILKGDKYIIGKHRVLFGYRIRILEINADVMDSPLIDWCCGDCPWALAIYTKFITNLHEKNDKAIFQLPITSQPRPLFKSKEFHDKINAIAKENGLEEISETSRQQLISLCEKKYI